MLNLDSFNPKKLWNLTTNKPIQIARLNLNGNGGEPQVDMLDIPGKGRCCVFIARFPYDPPE